MHKSCFLDAITALFPAVRLVFVRAPLRVRPASLDILGFNTSSFTSVNAGPVPHGPRFLINRKADLAYKISSPRVRNSYSSITSHLFSQTIRITGLSG